MTGISMAMPQLIDMEGAIVGEFRVHGRAWEHSGRGATWWVKCPKDHEFFARGTKLRQCLASGMDPICPKCSAAK